MNSSSQAIGGSTTISGTEVDFSCCIIQIDNPLYSPKRLKKSAGGQSCCIFRIPHTLAQANETAYKPKIVSIGPYHRWDGEDDKDHLQMIQEHKQRYLLVQDKGKGGVYDAFSRSGLGNGTEDQRFLLRGSKVRSRKLKLIDMIILDGCFILTFFIVVSKKSWRKIFSDDPIFTLRWILPTLRVSISKSFLSNLFEGVKKYTSQGYHVQWAGFKNTHFNSPWSFLSSCAALVLLLLTTFQAFFAAYP